MRFCIRHVIPLHRWIDPEYTIPSNGTRPTSMLPVTQAPTKLLFRRASHHALLTSKLVCTAVGRPAAQRYLIVYRPSLLARRPASSSLPTLAPPPCPTVPSTQVLVQSAAPLHFRYGQFAHPPSLFLCLSSLLVQHAHIHTRYESGSCAILQCRRGMDLNRESFARTADRAESSGGDGRFFSGVGSTDSLEEPRFRVQGGSTV